MANTKLSSDNNNPPKRKRGRPRGSGRKKIDQGQMKTNGAPEKAWRPKPKQVRLAHLLMNPDDHRSKQKKCDEVGVSFYTLWRWSKDPNFVEYMNSLVPLYVKAIRPEVWRTLAKDATVPRNIEAQKLYFELTGELQRNGIGTKVKIPQGQSGDGEREIVIEITHGDD